MIGVIGLINQILLSFIPFESTPVASRENQPIIDPNDKEFPRSLRTIFLQPLFLLACGTATLSNTAMVMIMSQFSIDMNRHQYEFRYISLVLEFHLLAMYFPSLITGYLWDFSSPLNLSIIGNVTYLLGIAVMYSVPEDVYIGYVSGMILIGIAWNFSYSSSTLMLSDCYRVTYDSTKHPSPCLFSHLRRILCKESMTPC
jgi:Na+/melibiose symporter-like transporter